MACPSLRAEWLTRSSSGRDCDDRERAAAARDRERDRDGTPCSLVRDEVDRDVEDRDVEDRDEPEREELDREDVEREELDREVVDRVDVDREDVDREELAREDAGRADVCERVPRRLIDSRLTVPPQPMVSSDQIHQEVFHGHLQRLHQSCQHWLRRRLRLLRALQQCDYPHSGPFPFREHVQ